MALEHRIESLKKRHADIDQKLRKEEFRLGANQIDLNRLKSLKLSLKDEIERLLQGERVTA
jgi:hypothetical protein